jgi:hypothetical protein
MKLLRSLKLEQTELISAKRDMTTSRLDDPEPRDSFGLLVPLYQLSCGLNHKDPAANIDGWLHGVAATV